MFKPQIDDVLAIRAANSVHARAAQDLRPERLLIPARRAPRVDPVMALRQESTRAGMMHPSYRR